MAGGILPAAAAIECLRPRSLDWRAQESYRYLVGLQAGRNPGKLNNAFNINHHWVLVESLTKADHPDLFVISSKPRYKVLVASNDEHLRNLRSQMLEREGCDVLATRNKQHGLALLHSDIFDLLLLDHSLSNKAKLEYAAIYRERNAAGKILSLTRTEDPPGMADWVLESPIRPDELIHAVRRLLSIAPQ